ncbi:hypothetical protein DL93DRAFT_2174045 [Clavulina sp. PMI_390]|nr:hypothetical protein DL93DRAFT_2174045 [Clavulina sp. PMI_390]
MIPRNDYFRDPYDWPYPERPLAGTTAKPVARTRDVPSAEQTVGPVAEDVKVEADELEDASIAPSAVETVLENTGGESAPSEGVAENQHVVGSFEDAQGTIDQTPSPSTSELFERYVAASSTPMDSQARRRIVKYGMRGKARLPLPNAYDPDCMVVANVDLVERHGMFVPRKSVSSGIKIRKMFQGYGKVEHVIGFEAEGSATRTYFITFEEPASVDRVYAQPWGRGGARQYVMLQGRGGIPLSFGHLLAHFCRMRTGLPDGVRHLTCTHPSNDEVLLTLHYTHYTPQIVPVARIVYLSPDAVEGDYGLVEMLIVTSEATTEEADLAYSTGNAVNESSIQQRGAFHRHGLIRGSSTSYEEESQMSTSEARHPTRDRSSSSPPIFAPPHGSSTTTAQNVAVASLAAPSEELSHFTNHLSLAFIPGSKLHQTGLVTRIDSNQSRGILDGEVKLEEIDEASTSRDLGQFLKRKHMDPLGHEEVTKRLKL